MKTLFGNKVKKKRGKNLYTHIHTLIEIFTERDLRLVNFENIKIYYVNRYLYRYKHYQTKNIRWQNSKLLVFPTKE